MSEHDDLFRELGRTLDVTPSRDFADGVRSRITRRRVVMRTTMAGLAIAASVLLVVVVQWPGPTGRSPRAERSPRALALGTVAGAEAPALHQDPDLVARPSAERSPSAVRSPRAERSPRALALGTVAGAEAPALHQDRLQVVTNQMAVLLAEWAGQRVTGGETETTTVEAVATFELTPVVVEPVVVLPVVIVDQRATVEGFPIVRRAIAALETK